MYNRDNSSGIYNGGLLVDFSVAQGDTIRCNSYGRDFFGIVVKKSFTTMRVHYFAPGWADEEYELTFRRFVGLERSFSTDWGSGTELSKFELKN